MGTQRMSHRFELTTQGPTYPPSEVMNEDGDFVVIGRINEAALDGQGHLRERDGSANHGAHGSRSRWGAAIVSALSPLPPFGHNAPYRIVRDLDLSALSRADRDMVLCTLPVPLTCNNYPMVFAPEQGCAHRVQPRPSYPFHLVQIPDARAEDGLRVRHPITLGQWVRASGELEVTVRDDRPDVATFECEFRDLVPNCLYTVMSLRQHDFHPERLTRPGPLGVPNVLMTDRDGRGRYFAELPDPFPDPDSPGANRVVNVILLWMSYQCSYGGAIGMFGLGGDVHAQLKLSKPSFFELATTARTRRPS
jgi:hypothetical protein